MKIRSFKPIILTISTILLFSSCTGSLEPSPTETMAPIMVTDDETTPSFTNTPGLQPTASPQPTTAPTPTPSPSPTSTAVPTNPHAVVGVEKDDVLNIREGSGVENPRVGTIPPYGTDIEVVGKSVEVGGSPWVPVHYQGQQGWVNSHYLAKQVGQADPQLLEVSNQVLQSIKEKDFSTLAGYVHPDMCLRFSPYPTIQPQDLVFCPSEISTLLADNTQYQWGQFDGSGKPIRMTFSQYYERFIYDVDFAHAEMIGFNQIIGTGNAINNIHEFYPQAVFVEYHYPEIDPQYGGMDWRSLRLVFKKEDMSWFLMGIVHGEWTI